MLAARNDINERDSTCLSKTLSTALAYLLSSHGICPKMEPYCLEESVQVVFLVLQKKDQILRAIPIAFLRRSVEMLASKKVVCMARNSVRGTVFDGSFQGSSAENGLSGGCYDVVVEN